jgi:hypothetical protein
MGNQDNMDEITNTCIRRCCQKFNVAIPNRYLVLETFRISPSDIGQQCAEQTAYTLPGKGD